MAKLLNSLLENEEAIPEEFLCSRLICLNKCANEIGKLENIRPIAVNGMIFKILERVILTRLEIYSSDHDIKIDKSQVGFIPKLGCDVNITRLRQRVLDVSDSNTNHRDNELIFFIDLKAAYDSVNHCKLFEKLCNMGYPDHLINAVKKIYSSARMRLNTFLDPINVNKGVMQGGIISHWLFNVYLNDLIISIKDQVFDVLAYADDLAVICKNIEEFKKADKTLNAWCNNNHIAVNKKKVLSCL